MDRGGRRSYTRATALLATAALLAGGAAGCSTREQQVPVECSAQPGELRQALEAAPGPVRLGNARLSDCLGRAGNAADLQTVGYTFTEVAAELGAEARGDPSGPEATQLGYLVGAVRERASRTGGLHEELARRLEQELRDVDTRAPAFQEGERAGRTSG